jgi:capsular polysaccharide biosynthesis protein
VREALGSSPAAAPWRRVFISRARARIRRLVNEEEIAPALARAGFEAVHMEDLSFEEQIRLMGETKVLLAPHGAGLTNMMFCPPGTHVVEIADTSYPNPNFYALACAMGLHYWLVRARLLPGEGRHRLDRDLEVDPAGVADVIAALEDAP